MSWNWTRSDERLNDPEVVRQRQEYGCGAACAVMLLADRGIELDEVLVAAKLPLPCAAGQLADRLNALSPADLTWLGGSLHTLPKSREEMRRLMEALGQHGSWAAQLIPRGQRDGHWVVIDGFGNDDTIAIRDPVGSRYGLPFPEYCDLMRHMVVVYEEGVPNDDPT